MTDKRIKGVADRSIIEQLQKQILRQQGSLPQAEQQLPLGLGRMEISFPGKVFPRAAIHEFISHSSQQAACTTAFMAVVLSKLMRQGSVCVWISTKPRRAVFAPSLSQFGIEPHRILFVDTSKPKQTLWALEEALKCPVITAVVGELNELDFNESRRMQLAVEQSRVTGFIHRFRPRDLNAVACVSRWLISALPSEAPDGLPGLGFPRWFVQLQKAKNGKPGEWQLQWTPGKGLEYLQEDGVGSTELKTG